MKRIEVAVGVLFNAAGQVLIGQRVVKDSYFQKWEFPGGKLEANETPQQALIREFAEEIGIQISQSENLMLLEHDYPDRQVRLHVQIIKHYTGQIQAMEGQALTWIDLDELPGIDFLSGNAPIVDALVSLADHGNV